MHNYRYQSLHAYAACICGPVKLNVVACDLLWASMPTIGSTPEVFIHQTVIQLQILLDRDTIHVSSLLR